MDYRGLVDHGEIWKKLAGSIHRTLSNFFKCLNHQKVFYRDLATKRIVFCLIATGLFVCLFCSEKYKPPVWILLKHTFLSWDSWDPISIKKGFPYFTRIKPLSLCKTCIPPSSLLLRYTVLWTEINFLLYPWIDKQPRGKWTMRREAISFQTQRKINPRINSWTKTFA